MYDELGGLLYVGISVNPLVRYGQHRLDKHWWSDVRSITIEHFPDRMAAEAAELDAIEEEKPRYNVMRRPMVMRTFYANLDVWESAKARADEEEKDISQVVRELLERYVGKR
jgi:hypothetical protein